MPKLVVHGALLRCSEGLGSSTLAVVPTQATSSLDLRAGTVMDFQPGVHIGSFGMCKALTNPQVASATAAFGTLAPQPCMPLLTAPWSPGAASVTFDQRRALTDDSKCNCAWGGSIEVTQAGSDIEIL